MRAKSLKGGEESKANKQLAQLQARKAFEDQFADELRKDQSFVLVRFFWAVAPRTSNVFFAKHHGLLDEGPSTKIHFEK